MSSKLPPGWDEEKIKRVIDHYEAQSAEDAVFEDEAVLAVERTLMQVPLDLVPAVRALIAERQRVKR